MNQLKPEHSRTITDLDRAAILLLSMGEENAAGIIKKLSRHEVKALSERMAKITNVTQDDVALILTDFFDCYRSESGVRAKANLLCRQLQKAAIQHAAARSPSRNSLSQAPRLRSSAVLETRRALLDEGSGRFLVVLGLAGADHARSFAVERFGEGAFFRHLHVLLHVPPGDARAGGEGGGTAARRISRLWRQSRIAGGGGAVS